MKYLAGVLGAVIIAGGIAGQAGSEFNVQDLNQKVQRHEEQIQNHEARITNLEGDVQAVQQQTGAKPAPSPQPVPTVATEAPAPSQTKPEPTLPAPVSGCDENACGSLTVSP